MNEEVQFFHPARISIPTTRQVELLSVVQERYLSGSDVRSEAIFLFSAEVSNNQLDAYFTRMSTKTLQNYVNDAKQGVAFLRSHNTRELPVGFSLDAQMFDSDLRTGVLADFYTVHGLTDTNDLISRISTGLVRDVSVGFFGGRMLCDICGSEFFQCNHFPGLTYDVKDAGRVVGTFTIDDARLAEVSGVYDGATPDAKILKAQRLSASGELSEKQVEVLEQRYRIHLPRTKTFAIPKEETVEEDILVVRSTLGLKPEEMIVQSFETLRKNLATAQEQINSLQPQAEDGKQYRSDLIEEALAEGVRVQGTGFNRTLYEETFRSAPLGLVKQMRDDWRAIANKVLPTGRTSAEEDTRQLSETTLIPDEAYS